MSFVISTDSTANLPDNIIKENDLVVTPLLYSYNGKDYYTTLISEFDGDSYYEMIKNVDVKTSTINIQQFRDAWEPLLKEGKDILHISISSGISSTYQTSHMAMEMLLEEYPDRTIRTIDTLAASLGEGLSVIDAIEHRKNGLTINQAADAIEEKKSTLRQVFTVDDLIFLKKGGRLSNAAALIGSLLNIKPILIGNELGQIVLRTKERGRKTALRELLKEYKDTAADAKNNLVCIAHCASYKDALWLETEIKQINPEQEVLNVMYEPVTGCHVGTGTVALFFWKK